MEPESNPYAPPQAASIEEASIAAPLASPWIRLGAQLLDGIVTLIVMVPLMWATGYISRVMENRRVGGGMFDMLGEKILWAVVGIVCYLAINWVFLQNGQTIGKKLVGIKIVRKNGDSIDAIRIITHRFLPVQLVSQVPCLGTLAVVVDALLIFRTDHNTLHDDIADTKVVVIPPLGAVAPVSSPEP